MYIQKKLNISIFQLFFMLPLVENTTKVLAKAI